MSTLPMQVCSLLIHDGLQGAEVQTTPNQWESSVPRATWPTGLLERSSYIDHTEERAVTLQQLKMLQAFMQQVRVFVCRGTL